MRQGNAMMEAVGQRSERREDANPAGLKDGGRAVSQGIHMDSRSFKGREAFSPRPSGGSTAPSTLCFSPVNPVSDF